MKQYLKSLHEWSAIGLGLMIPLSTAGTHLLLTVFMLTWFWSGDLKQQITAMIQYNPWRIAYGLFFLFLLGALYSPAPWDHIIFMFRKMSKLLYAPFLWSTFSRLKNRNGVLYAFLFSMLLTLGLGFFQTYTGIILIKARSLGNTSVFTDHLSTYFMMGFAAFILAHQAVLMPALSKRSLLLWGIICAMLYSLLFFSYSRSGYIIFFILSIVFVLQHKKFLYLKWWALGIILISTLTLCLSDSFKTRVVDAVYVDQNQSINFSKDLSLTIRSFYFKEVFRLWKQKPLFGFGTGALKMTLEKENNFPIELLTNNPHSEYLNVLFQLGLVGLIALLLFFHSLHQEILKLSNQFRYLAQGLLAAILCGCVINSWIMDFAPGYLFVVLMAALLSQRKQSNVSKNFI